MRMLLLSVIQMPVKPAQKGDIGRTDVKAVADLLAYIESRSCVAAVAASLQLCKSSDRDPDLAIQLQFYRSSDVTSFSYGRGVGWTRKLRPATREISLAASSQCVYRTLYGSWEIDIT
ncbi:hypothetical protein AC1031_020661 [Aphanomyces cochlioides]|nr:hypothetical protein AC1031_020661 [Aphanomyces cochlioides]